MATIRHEDGRTDVMRPGDNSGMMTMPENQEMYATGSRPSGGAAGATLYIAYLHVLWTLLYGFVIFPNHPSPDMLECHEEVYYNNQTEALERDKTCELDRPLIWGLAFLAGVASSVFSLVAIALVGIRIDLFTDHYFPSRSQNDTVEQEEEDTA